MYFSPAHRIILRVAKLRRLHIPYILLLNWKQITLEANNEKTKLKRLPFNLACKWNLARASHR